MPARTSRDGDGTGVDEQRRPADLQPLEQGRDVAQAAPVATAAAGIDTRGTRVEQFVHGLGPRASSPTAPQSANGPPTRARRVEGVEQRLGLVGRQPLDAERAREGDDDAVVGGAGGGVVVRGVERGGGSPAIRSCPFAIRGACDRWLRAETRSSGRRCWWTSGSSERHIATNPIGLVDKALELLIEGRVRGAPALLWTAKSRSDSGCVEKRLTMRLNSTHPEPGCRGPPRRSAPRPHQRS